jgi:AcrR family transcriptional regulator
MPRPDVSAERTQQIVEAAVAVFVRSGISNARMEDIANEAGLSKGTLYLYFDSKDALIEAILDSFMDRELAYAQELLEGDGTTALEKVNRFADLVVQDLEQLKELASLYMEFLSLATREESVRTIVQRPFHDFMEIFMGIVRQGIEKGEFRPVDPMAAALTIGTLIDGTILLWIYDPEIVDLGGQIKASLALLMDGLQSRSS